MDDAIRGYRQGFVLAILRRGHEAMTAGDIAETFATMALQEGHPEDYWRGATPASVAGHLRALEQAGEVAREGDRRNQRNGRPEPLWKPANGYDNHHPFPDHPQAAGPQPTQRRNAAPEPAASMGSRTSPYEHLSKAQLLTLLSVHDEISAAAHRFLADIRDITVRGRRELAAVGLEPSER